MNLDTRQLLALYERPMKTPMPRVHCFFCGAKKNRPRFPGILAKHGLKMLCPFILQFVLRMSFASPDCS
jgi:hypothetical protein